MRKRSMKKFGTPIWAAPGWAKEKVGSDGVGTPSLVRWASLRLAARSSAALRFLAAAVFFLADCFFARALSFLVLPLSFLPLLPVVVPGFWPLPLDGLVGLVVVGVVDVVVVWVSVVVVCVVVASAGGLGSAIETIGSVTFGIEICDSGVPGGTSTVTVICLPPWRVTTSVRFCADAGRTDAPRPAPSEAAATAAIRNLLVLMWWATLP